MTIRTVRATRYVTPLREGGSLPAIVEADDDGMYVLKFRGAGQGPRALIAELVAGEIGRALGSARAGDRLRRRSIRRSPRASPIPRSRPSSGQRRDQPRPGLPPRSRRVRFTDAIEAGCGARLRYCLVRCLRHQRRPNSPQPQHARLAQPALPDRPRGSALFHHAWGDYRAKSRSPFARIADHDLLPLASDLREPIGASARCSRRRSSRASSRKFRTTGLMSRVPGSG